MTKLHCCALLGAFFFFSTHHYASAEDTYFIDQHGDFNGLGDWWYQSFTVNSPSSFVLRVTSDFKTDCAILTPAQVSNFTQNRSFVGYAVFDDSFGTKSITLNPGTYYVAARNQISGDNPYRIELDTKLKLASDATFTYSFSDYFINHNAYVGPNGGQLWQPFTIQAGYRYFIDGCNSGLNTYIFGADQLNAFKNRGTFYYYPDYSGDGSDDTAMPGFYELHLAPGSYYLAFENDNEVSKAVTYTGERWKKITKAGSSLAIQGNVSWSISGKTINIKANKIVNNSTGGKSGSLRLRVWATKTPYTGSSISGYILGTRSLNPLPAGTYYSAITGAVAYTRPPSGTYYTTLTLEEYTTTGWLIRSYVNFNGTSRF